MRPLFLLAVLIACVGCLSQPEPTPEPVIQYPATWTPAPTPTASPLPPTATLVIQRTPGAGATRNPNARILPNAPRTGPGLWLAVTGQPSADLQAALPRAQVIVTDGASALRGGFTVLDRSAIEPEEALDARYNGMLVTTTDVADWSARRTAIAPRLLLVSVGVTDTGTLGSVVGGTDGARLENFMREPAAPLDRFPTEAEWQRDVAALELLSANSNLVTLTSTRLEPNANATSEQIQQWFDYTLASYLMGANSTHTFFGFEGVLPAESPFALLETYQVGTAIGPPFKQNGVYQRRFNDGLVLVNPAAEPYAFALSRTYRDANGALVDQVALPPHTGMILLNAE